MWCFSGLSEPINYEPLDRRPAVKISREDLNQARFLLYRNLQTSSILKPEILDPKDGFNNINQNNYFKNRKTIIFAHGWLSSAFYDEDEKEPFTQMKLILEALQKLKAKIFIYSFPLLKI